jgi:glycosyltransferase involved in cell wall biosynthesis
MKIRITHIINSFESGGAEAMLCRLLLRTDCNRFEPSVISLIDNTSVAGPIVDAGIPLATMGMRPGIPDPRGMARLIRHLRRTRPQLVQTWMDHSNLIGGVAARVAGTGPVLWGIHHSDHVPELTKRTTLWTLRACARLSRRLPARIICCSESARSLYSQRGFVADKLVVIPNGFDTAAFKPDKDARADVRRELGLATDTILIGLAARYHPLKDHSNFLHAAAILLRSCPGAHFLLCGNQIDADNSSLTKTIAELNLGQRCHLLGPRRDIARIHASLDIAASSSISEAFPLTIGESMACGVPCVATDVGDSAFIIGDTGRTVAARDSAALAAAWAELLSMSEQGRRDLGARARQRVKDLFDLDSVTRRYEATYQEVAQLPRQIGSDHAPHGAHSRLQTTNGCGATLAVARNPGVHDAASNGNGSAHSTANDRINFRILMVVESSSGGTGRHVLDLAHGLIDRGCEVHLVYSTNRIDQKFIDRVATTNGLHTTTLPMRTNIHPSDIAAVRAVRRYLRRYGPFDVIHGHSSKGGAVARLAAVGTGVPALYTIHGLTLVDPCVAWWKRQIYKVIEWGLSLRTARIIAVSPEEGRAAVRAGLGRSRVVLVPNGVDQPKLAPRAQGRETMGFDDDAVVVGFVGRLVDQKAPHLLIDAFAAATRAQPHLRLAIVGTGPLEQSLQDRAKRLGISDKVRWLAERDARDVLAAMDIFALSSRREGLPYVVLEAMTAGLPVVATASSGVESLIEQGVNGAIVPPDHTQALAGALIELADDTERRVRYGRASHNRASAFTVDRMVDRTLEAYMTARASTLTRRGNDAGIAAPRSAAVGAAGDNELTAGAMGARAVAAVAVGAGKGAGGS